jgi:hypothetical protein
LEHRVYCPFRHLRKFRLKAINPFSLLITAHAFKTLEAKFARQLEDIGIGALIPEDDLPRGLAPSLLERHILSKVDVDLIFLNVQSWGSATEFAQFGGDPTLARKLRILVGRKHHPIYGTVSSSGYLSDAYMTH